MSQQASTSRLGAALALGSILVIGIGCSKKSTDGDTDVRTEITLKFDAMREDKRKFISDNGWLEIWEVRQGQYTSLGKFRLDINRVTVDGNGEKIDAFRSTGDLATASRIAVTYETEPDASPDPSGMEILTANVEGGDSLDLRFEAPYEGTEGRYLVVTPSDGGGTPDVDEEDPTNPNCGVWFSGRDWGKPGFGLGLADAPAGWKYEGWLMYQTMPEMKFLSMGRFTTNNTLDESNPYLSDIDMDNVTTNYHFPGEDFLENPPPGLEMLFPLDVQGKMTFVMLEPDPDPMPDMPFMPGMIFCANIPNPVPTTTRSMPLDAISLISATGVLR